MKNLLLIAAAAGLFISAVASCATAPAPEFSPAFANTLKAPRLKTMRAFSSDQDLRSYLRQLAERQRLRQRALDGEASPASSVAKEKSDAKEESVTNVQHAGVDEGGIVKVHGAHLVVLRRGRIFTVAIGDGRLKPISAVDAFGPDINPQYTWYDEMLLSEDTVVVIGYSYERGGTEVGLFNIDGDGNLTYRSTYHLRSNDYYSSRNYASRLIGSKLIFYTPLYLNPSAEDPFQSFPAVRKWHKGVTNNEFQRIASASRVYRSEHDFNADYGLALHTVTVCDLANGGFGCQANSVVGPPGRVFYVSPDSVYVWVSEWVSRNNQTRTQSQVFRMPLDGSAPSALQVSGSPVDQFSFLQSQDDYLNVLVRSDSSGDGMWGAEAAAGEVALMRVPLARFSDGSDSVSSSSYRKLPKPEGYTFQNRFVGAYLLYGGGSGWGYPQKPDHSDLYVVHW